MPTPEYRERLLEALRAARKAGNPVLEQSILCALEGRDFDMLSCLPKLHPEIEEVLKWD